MNRKSLGADIYSPIRFNTSFNDSSLNADGSISEFCSGLTNAGSKVDTEKVLKLERNEDSCEFQTEKPDKKSKRADKKNKSGNSSLFSLRNDPSPNPSYKDSIPSSKLEENIFATSSTNTESAEIGQITVRRSLRIKEEKDSGKQSKERSSTKKNLKKDLAKFVTVRGDSRRSGDQKSSSCKSNVDILPTNFETLEDVKVSSVCSSKGSNNPEYSSTHLGTNSSSSVDCSMQTDLTLTELQTIIKKGLECSEKKEVPLSSMAIKNECINNTLKKSSDVGAVSKPAQIQANIMEKLVRDIVDPECCEIRQILYLQHIANSKLLFKILDELEEGRSKELLKENQQLRIENRQLRMENQQIRNENIQLRKTYFGHQ